MAKDAKVSDEMAKKFATEKDTPYLKWVRGQGLDIISAHYVPDLKVVDLKPWAERGQEEAQYRLGTLYENGQGVEKSLEEAKKWYRKAAERNHDGAQNNLGVCYRGGQGVEEDYVEAVNWFRKAA